MSRVFVKAVLALSLLGSALPVAASARYDEVGGGATKLVLDKGFLALMKRDGVKLSARAPATLRKGTVTFPAVRGELDPISGRATVDHDGALLLKAGRGVVSFKAL